MPAPTHFIDIDEMLLVEAVGSHHFSAANVAEGLKLPDGYAVIDILLGPQFSMTRQARVLLFAPTAPEEPGRLTPRYSRDRDETTGVVSITFGGFAETPPAPAVESSPIRAPRGKRAPSNPSGLS